MSAAPALLIFLFAVAFIILMIVLARHRKKVARERTEHLQAVANLLGWQFGQEAPMDWIPGMEKFALFNTGHGKSIKNVMFGHAQGIKSALFDYEYVTGSGKNQRIHYQSVVYFEPRDLTVPFFSLRPENFLHKFISALGYQDIDFGNRPDFSSQYLLRGKDEPAIRNAFNEALIAFYETNPGTSTDGGGNQLFVFREGYTVPPDQLRGFIDWASRLQNLFTRLAY